MSAIMDGGPAFPSPQLLDASGMPRYGEGEFGMTLRDYFAAKAMQAVICEPQWSNGGECSQLGKLAPELALEPAQQIARCAYILADAMLTAREAQP